MDEAGVRRMLAACPDARNEIHDIVAEGDKLDLPRQRHAAPARPDVVARPVAQGKHRLRTANFGDRLPSIASAAVMPRVPMLAIRLAMPRPPTAR